uniref:Uncharacterized protein n=1 Tax=Cyclophora tenuis TaxID=216820 RepID=A0A7S1GR98_CYCTE|mmetsp:Transcript_9105/g.15264  ORF Transcript_9105/g.15264 Transcript_9105/m.15264 type:complete len:218 (+) Transcript_9105:7-660(+)
MVGFKSFLCGLLYLASVGAFQNPLAHVWTHAVPTEMRAVIDPNLYNNFLLDPAVVAVVSAAAGAAAQVPRIQQLERDLEQAHTELMEMEDQMVDKIKILEDQLFEMDTEFEQQSAREKKKYDMTLREEIEKTTKKLKEDYQFSLDIKLKDAKSQMLSEKLDFVNKLTGDKQSELSLLRLQSEKLQVDNHKLEEALDLSRNELEKMKNTPTDRKWWKF